MDEATGHSPIEKTPLARKKNMRPQIDRFRLFCYERQSWANGSSPATAGTHNCEENLNEKDVDEREDFETRLD
jgi:hypothetical protein